MSSPSPDMHNTAISPIIPVNPSPVSPNAYAYVETRTSEPDNPKRNPNCPNRAPARHSPLIQNAIWKLHCLHCDKSLDLLFRGCVVIMLALLQMYESHDEIGWVEASMLAATIAGRGTHLARMAQQWCWQFLDGETCLPVNSVWDMEDFNHCR